MREALLLANSIKCIRICNYQAKQQSSNKNWKLQTKQNVLEWCAIFSFVWCFFLFSSYGTSSIFLSLYLQFFWYLVFIRNTLRALFAWVKCCWTKYVLFVMCFVYRTLRFLCVESFWMIRKACAASECHAQNTEMDTNNTVFIFLFCWELLVCKLVCVGVCLLHYIVVDEGVYRHSYYMLVKYFRSYLSSREHL